MRINPKNKYHLGKVIYKSGLEIRMNSALDPKTGVLKLGHCNELVACHISRLWSKIKRNNS
ncbi:hypothetical protein A3K93_05185 [Acinetobacter sp. NCu2D-2]|nr:hypothetical protein A3K93_05185 [Acinetobacter sp. NCu2D-2]